jgi:hypothetical protein
MPENNYKVKVTFWREKFRGKGEIVQTKNMKFTSPEIEKAFWDGFTCASYEWDSWNSIEGSKIFKDGTKLETSGYDENQIESQ